MRRVLLVLAFVATGAWAQEHGAPAPAGGTEHGAAAPAGEHAAAPAGEHGSAPAGEHGGGEHSGGTPEVSIWWKWANFAILAGGLGYMISKNAPAYFAARNEEIRQGLEEGARLQREANERAASMEARLKNLSTEIAELRTKAKAEIAAEGERVKAETSAALAKVQAHAEAEIASAAKIERAELTSYAADLALQLAQDKLRAQLTGESDGRLIQGFLKGMN